MSKKKKLTGVWSAAPTPLTEDMKVDAGSIERMVEHHLRLGVAGLFLAGTNGEGPWLPQNGLRTLTRSVVRAAAGRMTIAVQVTDNSSARILDNIDRAAKDGADMAVIAPPYFGMSYASPGDREKRIENLYLEAVRKSQLPVGIYDRGNYSSVPVPESVLARVYREPNVIAVKDSSVMESHMRVALKARKRRPGLSLFCGYEFDCVKYIRAGYDGLLLGGGVFNGYAATLIFDAVMARKFKEAERLQARMNRLMYAVYGGKKIRAWLSGEKYLLVRMGILKTYKNFTDYPLTRRDKLVIDRILEREREILLP